MTGSGAGSFCFLWGWRLLLVGRYPPACCSSRLPVFSLRLLQKVNGAQCQQLSLAVLLAWLKPSYQDLFLVPRPLLPFTQKHGAGPGACPKQSPSTGFRAR